jgi:O-antigen/teichoic acid export membrane protein
VLFLIVSRPLRTAPAWGVYAYGFAIAGFVYSATTLGIDEYGIRELHPTSRRTARLPSSPTCRVADLASL